ncbi:MAG TPA: DUF4292 domain-containing protein [Prolixibacteraceae bacterium]|nr:DUF4292 domain-containing protein [Prolixibacteraceae bacterium]HPT30180.1 DUF4292 domain-containing protein [Prolixibacteraceae bacterium]
MRYPVRPILIGSILLVIGFLHSCKTPEKVTETRLRPVSAVKLFKKAEENTFDYQTFSIKRINIQMDNGKTRTSFRAGVSALKDSMVLVSVTKMNILLARILLSHDSVIYVNYFDKTYYSGGYGPVCDLMNFDLDFQTIQAIVSANIFSLFDTQKELRDYKTWTENNRYVLQSEAIRKLSRMEAKGKTNRMEKFIKKLDEEISVIQTFYFDPLLYVIRKLELIDKNSPRRVELTFDEYEQIGMKFFPASVGMKFHSDSTELEVQARMSSFSIDDGDQVTLKIPEKYERIFLN